MFEMEEAVGREEVSGDGGRGSGGGCGAEWRWIGNS